MVCASNPITQEAGDPESKASLDYIMTIGQPSLHSNT